VTARIAILLAALALSGCASFRGARLYDSGTRALERGDAARAIADLEEAASLVPQASEIHNHLGLAYLKAERSDDALAAFRHAVALDCDNQAARHNLRAAEARAGSDAASVVPPVR
jgi:Flp pilus assembly protein TadD